MKYLLDRYKKHPKYKLLSFHRDYAGFINHLKPDEFAPLCENLKNDNEIKVLDLSNNFIDGYHEYPSKNFDSYSREPIYTLLSTNVTLKALDLSYNPLGEEFIDYLLKGLENNKTLVELNLYECHIRNPDLLKIIKHFETNDTIKHLGLGANLWFNEVCCDATLKMMSKNKTLEYLQCFQRRMYASMFYYEILQVNTTLCFGFTDDKFLLGDPGKDFLRLLNRNRIFRKWRELYEMILNLSVFLNGRLPYKYVQMEILERGCILKPREILSALRKLK